MDEVLGGNASTDKVGNEVRRIILMSTATVAALAAVKFGTDGNEYLVGTKSDDVLYGQGDNVIVYGKGFGYVF